MRGLFAEECHARAVAIVQNTPVVCTSTAAPVLRGGYGEPGPAVSPPLSIGAKMTISPPTEPALVLRAPAVVPVTIPGPAYEPALIPGKKRSAHVVAAALLRAAL